MPKSLLPNQLLVCQHKKYKQSHAAEPCVYSEWKHRVDKKVNGDGDGDGVAGGARIGAGVVCWHSLESLCLIICPHFIYRKWFANKEMAYLYQICTVYMYILHVTRDKNKHIFHTIVTFSAIFPCCLRFCSNVDFVLLRVDFLCFILYAYKYQATLFSIWWPCICFVSISFLLNQSIEGHFIHILCIQNAAVMISFWNNLISFQMNIPSCFDLELSFTLSRHVHDTSWKITSNRYSDAFI